MKNRFSSAGTHRRFRLLSHVLVPLVTLCFVVACSSTVWSTPLDDIGLNSLAAELGAAIPNGASVSVTQVEATIASGAFAPNPATFPDKTFNVAPTPSGFSSHANGVGGNFYGNNSPAPGITDIDVYEAGEFILNGFIRRDTNAAPEVETQDVQNHSWVGTDAQIAGLADTSGNAQRIEDIARDFVQRVDYVINRDDVTVVAALNNGSSSSVPLALANAFNAIITGVTDGDHSSGQATFESPNRQVPHIVAPSNFTSFANPYVSGAAALLIDHARSDSSLNLADRNEVVRSLLLAGATKDEFVAATVATGFNPWSNSATAPLDNHFGAGELNIHQSYDILEAGRHEADLGVVGNSTGWDLQSSATGQQTYFFDIPTDEHLDEFSAILTWNREIVDSNPFPRFAPSAVALNDLDLQLYSVASGTFNLDSLLAESTSDGNVEHIYFSNPLGINAQLGTGAPLGEGRYAIVVDGGNSAQDYALAFRSSVQLLFGCDFDLDGDCDPDDLALMYDSFGSADATFDLDGSGSVDAGDISAWLAQASDTNNPFNTGGLTYVLGDVDFNGTVDSTDLGVLLNNFSESDPLLRFEDGDLNGDSQIDSTDLGILLNRFGSSSALVASAVPEPTGIAGFLILLATFVIRRRTTR